MARVFVAGSFNVDHVWRVAALPPPVQYDSDKRRAARRTAQGP